MSYGDAGLGHRPAVAFLVGSEVWVQSIPSRHEGQEKWDLILRKLPYGLGDL